MSIISDGAWRSWLAGV